MDWLSWVQIADAVLRAFNIFCASVIDEEIGCERGIFEVEARKKGFKLRCKISSLVNKILYLPLQQSAELLNHSY